MKCLICKTGETKHGLTTILLEREHTTVVIKGVPASVCDNCNEYYLTEDMTGQVLTLAEKAVQNGAEIEVLRFAA